MAEQARSAAAEGGAPPGSAETDSQLDNSYQLDFDYESPVRPPRRWSSLNSNSAPQMSMSTSALFKSPRRSISTSGAAHQQQTSAPNAAAAGTGSTGKSFHDSISHMNVTSVTAPTSSGSYLRSNFKAQTKSSAAAPWQLPASATVPSSSSSGENALPEWKKKFLEMKKGGASADEVEVNVQETAKPHDGPRNGKHEAQPPEHVPSMERSNSQARGIAAASATPEWKRKFLQMKIATDAAQSHDSAPLDPSPGTGTTSGDRTENPTSPTSLPTWKKSIAKSRHVQAELLSLGLRESAPIDGRKVSPSDEAVLKAKGLPVSVSTNDGTPEWMKKFKSMKFEKEETVIEAGGKQDPGVVTNGNGVVVSWARTQTMTSTTVIEETNSKLSQVSTTKVKSKKTIAAVALAPSESAAAQQDAAEEPALSSSNEIFCQLCDERGHSAKLCPQLMARPVEAVVSTETVPAAAASPAMSSAEPDPPLDTSVTEKKKKKKSKIPQEVVGDEDVAHINGFCVSANVDPTIPDSDVLQSSDPACAGEPTIVTTKKKKKKKIPTEGDKVEGVDGAAPATELRSDPGETGSNDVHTEIDSPAQCQEATATVDNLTKKKKKKKGVAESDNEIAVETVETQLHITSSDGASDPVPSPACSILKEAQSCSVKSLDNSATMNESFSVTELSSVPTKIKRRKKKTRNDESDEGLNKSDSQSEISKAEANTEATTPMNESYSSTGESSLDVKNRDRTKKSRRKKLENDEPVGRMNDSCSSVESSVVSSQVKPPSKGRSFDANDTILSVGSKSIQRPHDEGTRTPQNDDDEFEVPDCSSASHRSSCEGSKSSSTAPSTKGSDSHQTGLSVVSLATKKRMMEERIQIVNTLNAFLEQSKERMANRESRIPEGSLRANKDTKPMGQKHERRATPEASATPPESSSRTNANASKTQSAVRKPHRRRSCTGSNGIQQSSSKRDGERRNASSDRPPSSPRKRAVRQGKTASRRRVARDPEPDLKPEEGPAGNEDVFQVLSHNASFQMSRQKIFLPTDFDDFDEADFSEGNSFDDVATPVQLDNADPFNDGFGPSPDVAVQLTETFSSFEKLSVTSPATVGSFDREVRSMSFSFSSLGATGDADGGLEGFGSDPFAQSKPSPSHGGFMDLAKDFADTSNLFWENSGNEPTLERRRSVGPTPPTVPATSEQKRRTVEAPTRLSRRRSATAGRSTSFQSAR